MSTTNDRIMTFKGKIGNHFSMNDKSYMIGSKLHKSIKTKAVRIKKLKTVLLAVINEYQYSESCGTLSNAVETIILKFVLLKHTFIPHSY